MQRVNNKVQTTGQGREGQIKSLLENIFCSLKKKKILDWERKVQRQKKHTASSVKHDGGDMGM